MSPWSVFALYVVFLVVAFGVRSFIQWRRTGRTGFQGISGKPLSVEWWGGVLFVVALVLGAAAPIVAAGGLVRTPVLPEPLTWIGLVIFLVGFGGTFAAQVSMGTSWRIGVDPGETTALVRSGMFGWVRNPIFSFMMLTGLGLAVLVPNALGWLAFVALVLAIELQVRFVEEPYLRRVHGAAYADYEATVGRFIPRSARFRGPCSK